MAHSTPRRPVSPLPWRCLQRPLGEQTRQALVRQGKALLRWQRDLRRWPRLSGCPDATPFVSLYIGGRLCGCFGSNEGAPDERLARAWLRAQADPRFGSIRTSERDRVNASFSFLRAPMPFDPAGAERHVEVGAHAIAYIGSGAEPAVLLPLVARDHGLSVSAMLATLAKKAGRATTFDGGKLWRFEVDEVVVRSGELARKADRAPLDAPLDEAANWLAGLVADDGRIEFARDPRTGWRASTGLMLHGRAAVALRALALRGKHPVAVARARRWLSSELDRARDGKAIEGWPPDVPLVAGTLALAWFAGIDCREWLRAIASFPEVSRVAWHAAQTVAALGSESPLELWKACIDDLTGTPWAPWTAIAAMARGDARTYAQCTRALIDSIRDRPPHEGGVVPPNGSVPETALTALVAEALTFAAERSRAAASAVTRARRFLAKRQLLGDTIPAPLDPAWCAGAFSASPVVDSLRCDISGHALSALAQWSPLERP